jgi:general secretion pathway protein I
VSKANKGVWPQIGGGWRGAFGRRGFTLLEVLLAFALFAVAVVVLATSYLNIITSLEAVKTDRAFDQEVRWVREQVLREADLKEVEKGGELRSPDNTVVRWQASVLPAAVPDLFTVELRLELVGDKKGQQDTREHTERLTVLRPSWSEPVERAKIFEEAKQRIEEDRRMSGLSAGSASKSGKAGKSAKAEKSGGHK